MLVSQVDRFIEEISRVPCYDGGVTLTTKYKMCHDCAARVLALWAALLEPTEEGPNEAQRSEAVEEFEELPF